MDTKLTHINSDLDSKTDEHRELEQRIAIRTKELEDLNKQLQEEIFVRCDTELALRQSKKKYRQLIEIAQQGIIVLDKNGNIIFVNPYMAEMLGYHYEEMRHKHIFCFMTAEYQIVVEEKLKNRRRGMKEIYDFVFQHRDGSFIHVSIGAVPIFDDKGNYNGALSCIVNITKRKKAEIALRQSEQKFRTLIESMGDALFLCDFSGKLVEVNQHACQSLDYNKYELMLLTLPDIDISLSREKFLKITQQLRVGLTITDEGIHRQKNGSIFPVEVRFTLIEYDNKRLIMSISRDISERKATEAALEESERRYRTLASLSPVGISHADEYGRLLYVNERWCKIAGITAKEACGEGWFQAIHPDDRTRVYDTWNFAVKNHIAFKAEYRFLHLDGTIVWALGESMAEYNDYGEIIGFVITTTDITKHREAEEQIQQHRIDLAHVSRINTIGEMASGIAHELNQPLTSIVNYIGGCLERMQKIDLPKEIVDAMRRAATQAERAGEIIHRLKDFLQKGKLTKTTIDINQTIIECMSLLDHEISKAAVDLKMQLFSEPIFLQASKIHFEQVILNVVLNAIEAMTEAHSTNRLLLIRTEKTQENRVLIKIRDTGPGISTLTIKQIFDPFFTTKEMGMGMGLSISRSIIEAHNGHIIAQSSHDGVEFLIALPLSEENTDE